MRRWEMHKHLIVASRAAAFLRRLFPQKPAALALASLRRVTLAYAIRLPDPDTHTGRRRGGQAVDKGGRVSRPPCLLFNGHGHLDPLHQSLCPIFPCFRLNLTAHPQSRHFPSQAGAFKLPWGLLSGRATLRFLSFSSSPRTDCQAKLGGTVGGDSVLLPRIFGGL
ncbi:hypothetical protein J3F83DRAFT_453891 [Trichoderma novae-zelandiae]